MTTRATPRNSEPCLEKQTATHPPFQEKNKPKRVSIRLHQLAKKPWVSPHPYFPSTRVTKTTSSTGSENGVQSCLLSPHFLTDSSPQTHVQFLQKRMRSLSRPDSDSFMQYIRTPFKNMTCFKFDRASVFILLILKKRVHQRLGVFLFLLFIIISNMFLFLY